MKIAIVVIVRDAEIQAFFSKRKAAVIPKNLSKKGHRFNLQVVNAHCGDDELIQNLIEVHAKHDAVGVLIEAGDENRLNGCACAVYSKTFSPKEARSKNSLQNYFASSLGRWLKNLLFLKAKFDEGKNRKCLMLPQYSFSASELDAIFQLCRAENEAGRFTQSLETQLKHLRGRSNPKKHKHDSSSNEYLVDDGAKHFELGKERHGQSETKRPPHAAECEFTARARFGMTMDRLVHYNVSLASGLISGSFRDCHADQVNQKGCEHLNMFPNGFIR